METSSILEKPQETVQKQLLSPKPTVPGIAIIDLASVLAGTMGFPSQVLPVSNGVTKRAWSIHLVKLGDHRHMTTF